MLGLITERDGRTITAEVRREIVESYLIGGIKMSQLSKTYGVTVSNIKMMVFRYRPTITFRN